jgi:hypothetical protein
MAFHNHPDPPIGPKYTVFPAPRVDKGSLGVSIDFLGANV